MAEYVKISRNAERFWCEVQKTLPNGDIRARVANHLRSPLNPAQDAIITIDSDEDILDRMTDEQAAIVAARHGLSLTRQRPQ